MCGITGIISAGQIDARLVRGMAQSIAHRGPDDEGVWLDETGSVALGHRRLSIIDLSPHGHQPMASRSGRFVLAYNGEIYNFGEIRRELEAVSARQWRGHSDTEVLIEAIAQWGLEGALQRTVGMFALALWDKSERRLHLARDRFGEKPLYWGWVGREFVFGSELKAIRAHPRFGNPVSRRAVRLLAARAYIPAPHSIYERIFKLDPGCILSVPADIWAKPLDAPPRPDMPHDGLSIRRYWSYREVVAEGLANPITDEAEALSSLEAALAEAIRGQSVADVPVGAFLSGGIDSSTVVALYRKHSPGTVRTFSIGFEEEAYNEADHAKAVARHFETEHHERYVTVSETRNVIPLLPAMYDEPFADSSQIPTHLVSRFAREQVTVALSGDGGDELFGGYNRHVMAPRLWEQVRRIPHPVRRLLGAPLGQVPGSVWDGLARYIPGAGRQSHVGTKLQKGLRLMAGARRFDDVYHSFLDEWSLDSSPVANAGPVANDMSFDLDVAPEAPDSVRMMYSDAISYLPDDILCKVDRAAMAVSLETRVPFLDHRVAALAARIPVSMKISDGTGKRILRKLLFTMAPPDLFERPKAGFTVPIGEWLRGPLRPWAEALFDPARMRTEGFFDPGIIQARWRRHLARESDSTAALWPVLMFQAWCAETERR